MVYKRCEGLEDFFGIQSLWILQLMETSNNMADTVLSTDFVVTGADICCLVGSFFLSHNCCKQTTQN